MPLAKTLGDEGYIERAIVMRAKSGPNAVSRKERKLSSVIAGYGYVADLERVVTVVGKADADHWAVIVRVPVPEIERSSR
jgi:hypothetical protein